MKHGIAADELCRLPDTPAAEARRRFEGGAARHSRAMHRFTSSRDLEVAPIRYLLPEKRSFLLDLFAGTGLASSFLRAYFDSTLLIEPHMATAAGTSNSPRRRACALAIDSFKNLPQADLAVCLAGFHHVLGPGSVEDRPSHRQQRLNCLRLWLPRLARGGRLVIADVPSLRVDVGWTDGPLDAFTLAPHERGGSPSRNERTPFTQASTCRDLGDYVQRMTAISQQLRLRTPEPALFFDHVVSARSPYGHVACYDSPAGLANLLKEAGFKHVRAFVAATPWQFPTKLAALWFVHELLGIGSSCSDPIRLSAFDRKRLEAEILGHLDLRQLPNGSWAVSWKLMYVTGDRP